MCLLGVTEVQYCYPSFLAEDLRLRLSKVIYDPKFSVETRNVYLADVLPTWLAHFEKLAPELNTENNDSFFVSGHLTWIDYIMFELIDSNVEFSQNTNALLGGKDLKEDILGDFPRLSHFYETFYRRQELTKYMKSKRRYPFKLPFPPSVVETKTF